MQVADELVPTSIWNGGILEKHAKNEMDRFDRVILVEDGKASLNYKRW